MSIIDKVQESIDGKKGKFPPERLKEIKTIAIPVGNVWSNYADGKYGTYKERRTDEELRSFIAEIKGIIQKGIDDLSKVGVEIQISDKPKHTGNMMSMDTNILIDGEKRFEWGAVTSQHLGMVAEKFDRALSVIARLEEELGVRTGDEEKIASRKHSDAEANAIGSFYSDARKRAKASGSPTWVGD